MRRRLPVALFAGISTIAFSSIASAADMPVKAKAPPPVVSYDWTGFYIGGYYGTGITHTKAETPGTVLGTHDFNQSGLTLGATAGYNWQFNPNWLVGLEGDIGYLSGNRTDTDWDDLTMVGVSSGTKPPCVPLWLRDGPVVDLRDRRRRSSISGTFGGRD